MSEKEDEEDNAEMLFENQLAANQDAHLKKMNKNYRGTFYIVDDRTEESKSIHNEKMSDHNPINDNDDGE